MKNTSRGYGDAYFHPQMTRAIIETSSNPTACTRKWTTRVTLVLQQNPYIPENGRPKLPYFHPQMSRSRYVWVLDMEMF